MFGKMYTMCMYTRGCELYRLLHLKTNTITLQQKPNYADIQTITIQMFRDHSYCNNGAKNKGSIKCFFRGPVDVSIIIIHLRGKPPPTSFILQCCFF